MIVFPTLTLIGSLGFMLEALIADFATVRNTIIAKPCMKLHDGKASLPIKEPFRHGFDSRTRCHVPSRDFRLGSIVSACAARRAKSGDVEWFASGDYAQARESALALSENDEAAAGLLIAWAERVAQRLILPTNLPSLFLLRVGVEPSSCCLDGDVELGTPNGVVMKPLLNFFRQLCKIELRDS
jgi:hypothetical protein